MKEKLTTLAEAAARIPAGATVAIGGSMVRRQPNALVRELIRQGKTDLTILTFAGGTAVDLLAAAGAICRWEGIYSGLFWYGQSYNFRRGVERGAIQVGDFSESAMVARLRAAAQGLPFAVTGAMLGTDMAAHNPGQIRAIDCPFTGQPYHAVRAAEADFTLVHGYVADPYGNVQMPVVRDTDDVDYLFALGSRRLIVTVERIVPHEVIAQRPALTYIPHILVEALVLAPYGAHPVACDGFYNADDEHLAMYVGMARAGATGEYLEQYVMSGDEWSYLERVGGIRSLCRLNVGGAA